MPSNYTTPEQVEAALDKREIKTNKSQCNFEKEVSKDLAMDRQQFAVRMERFETQPSASW